MGNQLIADILHEPLSEKLLQGIVAQQIDNHRLTPICHQLLSGKTPSNFSYGDLCERIGTLADSNFVIIPWWTFNLSRGIQHCATSFVNAFPVWSDTEMDDPQFFRNVTIMMPLFLPGASIGHARISFFDCWDQVSSSSLLDEQKQWIHKLKESTPLPTALITIILEFGLCNSRFLGDHGRLKILDSIPELPSGFHESANMFDAITSFIVDESWCPRRSNIVQKLRCCRMYFTSVQPVGIKKQPPLILPSTTQLGLECIIVSMVRIVARWINPHIYPIEDCVPLCENKKGRRILVQLLLLAEGVDVDFVEEGKDLEFNASLTGSSVTGVACDDTSGVDVQYFVVVRRPNFCVLATNKDFVLKTNLDYGSSAVEAGYEIFESCRWQYPKRQQDFSKGTILVMNDKVVAIFVCPVRKILENRWYFIVLGSRGYGITPARGYTGRGGIFHYQALDSDAEVSFTPLKVNEKKDFPNYIASLPDPNWKSAAVSPAKMDKVLPPVSTVTPSPKNVTPVSKTVLQSQSSQVTPRHSKRRVKPRKLFTISVEKKKRVRFLMIGSFDYNLTTHLICFDFDRFQRFPSSNRYRRKIFLQKYQTMYVFLDACMCHNKVSALLLKSNIQFNDSIYKHGHFIL